ncbi:MAG: hypothetical protein CMJ50_05040 [Planctomycetaceae bacterium]|nr:hypothetical protein [Planctomycetaceae bacterium]
MCGRSGGRRRVVLLRLHASAASERYARNSIESLAQGSGEGLNEGGDELLRGPVNEVLAPPERCCENRISMSHKEGLQRDLEGGNGTQRMLFECRFEMSKCEFRRMLGRVLRRFAEGAQRGADRTLGLVESFPDAVRRGITQSASEALERLPPIAGEDGLPEKLPQAVGVQEESFDFVGDPQAEGSSAASGTIPIAAEDTPSTDCLLAQMHGIKSSQESVANQVSNLFAMRTSRHFQRDEQCIDIVLRTANPPTHDWLPPPRTRLRKGSMIPCQHAAKRSRQLSNAIRGGV